MNITLEFPWNKDTYVKAGEIAYKYKMNYSYKKYVGYFFLAMLLYGILVSVGSQKYLILYLGTLLSIYWFYIKGMLQKSRLKKQFEKENFGNFTMKFSINKTGIKINGNFVPWSHISLVIAHPQGFLLERKEGYPYLPATAFKSEEDVLKFIEIVEQNKIPMKNVK